MLTDSMRPRCIVSLAQSLSVDLTLNIPAHDAAKVPECQHLNRGRRRVCERGSSDFTDYHISPENTISRGSGATNVELLPAHYRPERRFGQSDALWPT